MIEIQYYQLAVKQRTGAVAPVLFINTQIVVVEIKSARWIYMKKHTPCQRGERNESDTKGREVAKPERGYSVTKREETRMLTEERDDTIESRKHG